MSDTPPYAELEREMQRIPGFQPRRSGMVISHLSGKICKNKACVYEDILHEFMAEVIEGPFMERAESLSCRLQPLFSKKATTAVSRNAGGYGNKMWIKMPGVGLCTC